VQNDPERARITLAAASMRLVLGTISAVALPIVQPSMREHLWVLLVYLAVAGLFLWLLVRDLGGRARSLGSGLVDLLLVTFLVHHVGSAATMLVALYVLAVALNTLVIGRTDGLLLGGAAALLYAGLLLAEVLGALPYAPDGPPWLAGAPSVPEAMFYAVVMGAMTLAAGALVGAVSQQLERRQEELVDANRKLREQSLRDPLTRLYNRRYLMERLDAELARVRRGRSLSVVMVDLDRFKRVNDDTGHTRGDALLVELAEGLAASVREVDVVGRYGGDEFVAILPDTAVEAAEAVAARIVGNIRAIGTRFDAERPVTASVGVAVGRADDDPRKLLQRADRASYAAKGEGGDRLVRESLPPRA